MTFAEATGLGSYERLGLLGAASMGEVYRARNLKVDRDAAIKVLPRRLCAEPPHRIRAVIKYVAAERHEL